MKSIFSRNRADQEIVLSGWGFKKGKLRIEERLTQTQLNRGHEAKQKTSFILMLITKNKSRQNG